MSENEVKEQILNWLYERCGVCGHCGKRTCAGKGSHSVLPLTLKTDDVLRAINLDNYYGKA